MPTPHNPLVSVVIPSYNHAEYVTQAIQSVLCQQYQPIELIVIDDGSTDATPEIVGSLAEQHGFQFIVQANRGVSHALNRAIREYATGEYIAVMASDDYMHPEKIHKQIACFRQHPQSQLCFTQAIEFNSHDGRWLRTFPTRTFAPHMFKHIVLTQPFAAGSVMYSAALFQRLGGYAEELRLEDWDFLIRAAAQTTFCSVYEPLVYYRSHPQNTFKTLGRGRVYQEKKRVLMKNRQLIPTHLLWRSLLAHYLYDHGLYRLTWLNLRGRLH